MQIMHNNNLTQLRHFTAVNRILTFCMNTANMYTYSNGYSRVVCMYNIRIVRQSENSFEFLYRCIPYHAIPYIYKLDTLHAIYFFITASVVKLNVLLLQVQQKLLP